MMLLVAPAASAGARTATAEYGNARFGYWVSYPRNLLLAMPEADNGDGREFHPVRGHGKAAVWGEWLDPEAGATAQDEERTVLASCAGGRASYRLDRADLRVLSCVGRDGNISYDRIVQSKAVVVVLEISYPEAERSSWDPITASMSNSLHVPGPSYLGQDR